MTLCNTPKIKRNTSVILLSENLPDTRKLSGTTFRIQIVVLILDLDSKFAALEDIQKLGNVNTLK